MTLPTGDDTVRDIERYAAALGRLGQVLDFDISALDRLGVPVTSCSLLVDGSVVQHGNGYGATPAAARLSGLGELAEGAVSARHVADLRSRARSGSRQELVRAEGADRVVDPRELGLPAGSPYTEEVPLTWVPTARSAPGRSAAEEGGETVWVPLEFVASEPGELAGRTALIRPVTNGLGAGFDLTRARNHGLLEILQRHTNGLRFRALDRRSPVVEPAGLPPSVGRLVEMFEACGVHPVVKHAATTLGVVSTYVVGTDDDPDAGIRLSAGGEAAHPDAEVSSTKALLEFANSRARKAFFFGDAERARQVAPAAYWQGLPTGPGEVRAYQALRAWGDLPAEELGQLTAPDTSRAVRYADVVLEPAPQVSTQEALLDHLLRALAADDVPHDVLTASSELDGVVVAKTMVTGLEVEILSYGRIGEAGVREALAGELDLVRLGRPGGSHSARVLLTPAAEERLGGPAWYSYEVAARIVGPLYPLYREPARHSVALG